MTSPQHHRAFGVTVIWTLGLLLLGSIVHATESSLACPDWPTCFGTMMPEMEGGVFWEHLHRLVAGGLVILFVAATYLTWSREAERPWVRRTALAGVALLIVQSVFGGVTVLMRLPDSVSTTHLALAFGFLSLTVVLHAVTSPRWPIRETLEDGVRRRLRALALSVAGLTFVQSVLGAAVRHMDAGLMCPDVPLCLGRWVPPLVSAGVAAHFAHRVAAVLLTLLVLGLGVFALRSLAPCVERRLALAAVAVVLAQLTLGVLSVTSSLAPPAVSLHTLGAASLLALSVALATNTFAPRPAEDTTTGRPRAVAERGG